MAAALITGASTGIGKEFAGLFAADAVDVVLVASPRSQAQLEAQAEQLSAEHGVRAEAIAIDLAAPSAASDLHARVADLGLEIEFLVNNAGFGIVGLKFQDCDPGEVRRLLAVNVETLTELTALQLPAMVERGRGRVLNVSSISGYIVPHGLESVYAASKAYVVSFSESLAEDLRGTGVTCTHLAPGPVRTEFFATAGLPDDRRLRGLYMEPAAVARSGYKAMRAGRRMSMPGLGNKAMRVAATFSPSRRLTAAISGHFVVRD